MVRLHGGMDDDTVYEFCAKDDAKVVVVGHSRLPRAWAVQGVIALESAEDPAVSAFKCKPPLFVFLNRKERISFLERGCVVYASRLEDCLERINVLLAGMGVPPVVWGLDATHVGIDGACVANGTPRARAAYAVVFEGGPLQHAEIVGLVPARKIKMGAGGERFEETAEPATPTNNRGEYLAGCWALLALLRAGVRGPVVLVTDSRVFMKTMEEWLPARRKKGTARGLKNYDLVCVAEQLLAAVRRQTVLTFEHIRSHQPRKDTAAWRVNFRADEGARNAIAAGKESMPWFLAGPRDYAK